MRQKSQNSNNKNKSRVTKKWWACLPAHVFAFPVRLHYVTKFLYLKTHDRCKSSVLADVISNWSSFLNEFSSE